VLADAVDGTTAPEIRDTAIRMYKTTVPVTRVLVNYGVLTTGFDAPQTSAVVIARPTRSLVLYSQMVGRGIRGPKAGGNKKAVVVTVVDPSVPAFGSIAAAFTHWEDLW
jgi:superfamily II DNA or RNA helicase